MGDARKSVNSGQQERAEARRKVVRASGNPPQAAAPDSLTDAVRNSPYVAAQAKDLASSFGAANNRAGLPAVAAGVAQLTAKEVGKIDHSGKHPGGVIDSNHVVADIGQDHTYKWPSEAANTYFNGASYDGAVTCALEWGLTAGEGTAGWFTRQYTPGDFNDIAVEAGKSTQKLAGKPALNNQSNKTLIAIRAFRAAKGANMAEKTRRDLIEIELRLKDRREALAHANLIPDAADPIDQIKADPAEAHPGTLPTAKVIFGSGATVYFKGRSSAVEDALVGKEGSAAKVLSSLKERGGEESVGLHSFVPLAPREGESVSSHVAEDVGKPPVPGMTTRLEAVHGWLTAAKAAALISLSGTTDLHASNIITGKSGKKHIIDAEFLLDATAWDRYAQAAQEGKIYNFRITDAAPDWLLQYTKKLEDTQKLELGDDVAKQFVELGLDQEETQEAILGPIRNMLEMDELLRISPLPTQLWLEWGVEYQHASPDEKKALLQDIWKGMVKEYQGYHIALENKDEALQRIETNFKRGMVPLFHLSTHTRVFYLNKNFAIGEINEDRSSERLLELTKMAFNAGYKHMVLSLRAAIVKA